MQCETFYMTAFVGMGLYMKFNDHEVQGGNMKIRINCVWKLGSC